MSWPATTTHGPPIRAAGVACALVFCVFAPTSARAQRADVQVWPLHFLVGWANDDTPWNPWWLVGSAELLFGDRVGVEATVAALPTQPSEFLKFNAHNALNVGLAGRYYPRPRWGGDRFYGLAYARYEDRDEFSVGSGDPAWRRDVTRWALGAGAGFKWVADFGLFLDVGGGIGHSPSLSVVEGEQFTRFTSGDDDADVPRLDTFLRFGVGFRFGGSRP